MKILVTGRGTSGSWAIRGDQLGRAIGATVDRDGRSNDFDLTIVVKRLTPDVLARVSGPIVIDLVDGWPQPAGSWWDKEQALTWLTDFVGRVNPVGIVAATGQMARDCERFGVPVLWLPHHARPGQVPNPIRQTVYKVGYEGSESHLGRWRGKIERECNARGWRFVLQPACLADVDIIVGLREADGYPARYWKSNVKAANAQATGTPCVLSPEAGYLETQTGAEFFVEDDRGLALAFDKLSDYQTRIETARTLRAADVSLATVAEKYRGWLSRF